MEHRFELKISTTVELSLSESMTEGPFVGERIIDVSKAAAKELGMIVDGVATVRIEVDATSVLGSPDDAVRSE